MADSDGGHLESRRYSHVKTFNVRMILLNLFNLAFIGTFSSNRSGEVLV